MSLNLRNGGLKGWAATCTVAVVLLWLFCALMSFWKGNAPNFNFQARNLENYIMLTRLPGVWQGKLFFAPGLQGSLEREEIEKRQVDPEMPSGRKHNPYGLAFHCSREGEYLHRKAMSDGSYKKGKLEDEPRDMHERS